MKKRKKRSSKERDSRSIVNKELVGTESGLISKNRRKARLSGVEMEDLEAPVRSLSRPLSKD